MSFVSWYIKLYTVPQSNLFVQIPIASIKIKYCYYPKFLYVRNFRYSRAIENCIFLFNEIIVLKEDFLLFNIHLKLPFKPFMSNIFFTESVSVRIENM